MDKTTLISGANAGLGFEAARQLLSRSDERVLLTVRSEEKALAAVAQLRRQTRADADRVDYVTLDLMDPASVEAALKALEGKKISLDGVVLNAGGVAPFEDGGLPRTPEGDTTMFAMNVGGHVRLLHGLLARGLLGARASVVFSSSEVCRGIPVMGAAPAALPPHEGSLEERVLRAARGDHLGSETPDPLAEYGLVKLLGTAWMRYLAAAHSEHRFYAISPGASAGTNGTKNMPLLMGLMMKYVMFPTFRMMGRAHGVRMGAARYLDGLDGSGLESGHFYASPYPHMSGPLVRQEAEHQPLLEEEALIEAVGRVFEDLAPSRGTAVPSASERTALPA
ncbi:MAG: SDR family NAD(P)-dependent oxidoreductase [Myxococcota bacterium]